MSEEKIEENVGASLVSALFETVQAEPTTTTEGDVDQPMIVQSIGTALDNLGEPPMESVEESQEETEQKEENTEQLNTLDKSLFEGTEVVSEPEVKPEPTQESQPVQEPVQEEDLTWLTADQRKRLDLIEFAEGNFSEHEGLRNKYVEFFKAQKDYIESRLQEDPDASLDDSDHEYQNFLKRKKPEFSQDDFEKVVEFRTRKITKEETLQELKPEIDALKEEQRKQKIEPTVEGLKKKTMDDIKSMVPDSIKKVIEAEGPQVAYEKNPVEFEIVNRVATSHQEVMFAFHEISQGLAPYDSSNKTHIRLANFIDQLEASLPDKDGKKFANIGKYQSMDVVEKKKHYTLSPDEVVEHANNSAKRFINFELNQFEEKLRKSGFIRTQSQQPANSQQFKQPKPTKPAPREGHSGANSTTEGGHSNPVLSVLGM